MFHVIEMWQTNAVDSIYLLHVFDYKIPCDEKRAKNM